MGFYATLLPITHTQPAWRLLKAPKRGIQYLFPGIFPVIVPASFHSDAHLTAPAPQHFTNPFPSPDLQSLATHPSYRRLGAASRVLQWGIDQAEAQAKEQNPSRDDRNKIEGAYLESTPAGLSTYLKLGFEEVGSMEHDLGDGKEGYKFVCLMKRVG